MTWLRIAISNHVITMQDKWIPIFYEEMFWWGNTNDKLVTSNLFVESVTFFDLENVW